MLAWWKSLASHSDLHGFGTLLKEMRIIFQLQGTDVQKVVSRLKVKDRTKAILSIQSEISRQRFQDRDFK